MNNFKKSKVLIFVIFSAFLFISLSACSLFGTNDSDNTVAITVTYNNDTLSDSQILDINSSSTLFSIKTIYNGLTVRFKDLTVDNGQNYYKNINYFDYDETYYYYQFNPFNIKSIIPFIKSPGFYKVTFENNSEVYFTLYINYDLVEYQKLIDEQTVTARFTDAITVGDYIYATAVYDDGADHAHVYLYKLDKNGTKIDSMQFQWNTGVAISNDFDSPISKAVLAVDDNSQYLYVAFSFNTDNTETTGYGNIAMFYKIDLSTFTSIYSIDNSLMSYSGTDSVVIKDMIFHDDGNHKHLYVVGENISSSSKSGVFWDINDDNVNNNFINDTKILLSSNGGTDSSAFSSVADSNKAYLYISGYTTDSTGNLSGAVWKIDLASSINNYFVESDHSFNEDNAKFYDIVIDPSQTSFYVTGFKANFLTNNYNIIKYTLNSSLDVDSRNDINVSDIQQSGVIDESGLSLLRTDDRFIIGGYSQNDTTDETNSNALIYISHNSSDIVNFAINYADFAGISNTDKPQYKKDSKINKIIVDSSGTIYCFGFYDSGTGPSMLFIKLNNY